MIYRGKWRETTVAIKIFKIESDNAVRDFFSECAAMEALRHPNIVMYLGACTKAPNFAIVLEYCTRGSLWSTIQNLEIPLSWDERRRFALDTAKGVNYLHMCNPPIIHRDLKSLNLLIDDSNRVKLADFGWTKGLD